MFLIVAIASASGAHLNAQIGPRVSSVFSIDAGHATGGGTVESSGEPVVSQAPILGTAQIEFEAGERLQILAGFGLLSGVARLSERDRRSRWAAPVGLLGARYTLLTNRPIEIGVAPYLAYADRVRLRITPSGATTEQNLFSRGGLGVGVGVDVRYPATDLRNIGLHATVRYIRWDWPLGSTGALSFRPLTFGAGIVIRH